MKNSFRLLFILLVFILNACKETTTAQNDTYRNLSDDFKAYWYDGLAEISTYQLMENRYGQLREGTATLIFVTEDFVSKKQVKADQKSDDNISVLKLNSVKKFVTGVYPYSIMQSTFLPLQKEGHATKITASIQEWCGQTFLQLNNKKKFEINAFSYFESEGDQSLSLNKSLTENELWNSIRLNGIKDLPNGEVRLIPSFEYIRLHHIDIKSYAAKISHTNTNGLVCYSIIYPELQRTLTINFQEKAPHIIESWSDGTGDQTPTTATRITTKKLPYWNQKSAKDKALRDELGL